MVIKAEIFYLQAIYTLMQDLFTYKYDLNL